MYRMVNGEAFLDWTVSFLKILRLHLRASLQNMPGISCPATPELTGASLLTAVDFGRGNYSHNSCSKVFAIGNQVLLTDYQDKSLNSGDYVISLATQCLNSLILNLNNSESSINNNQ